MTTETLFVVNQGGCERWDITKRRVVAEPALADAFLKGTPRKNPAVVEVGGNYGKAGVSMLEKYEMWSVRVLKLALNAPFVLTDGVHTPAFNSPDEPIMPMIWTPPSNMSLVLGITVLRDGIGPGTYKFYAGDHYLVAFSGDGNMWRLPLSNLYEDCKLCHGQEVVKRPTAMEIVGRSCDLFNKSQWNADLYAEGDRTRREATRKMFRFKPLEKGFEQLAIETDWTKLCQKVALEKLNQLIQLV